ncbi:heme/hemin ABC transporter substrate-binding protein [Mariniradius sediminis]|uniref:ABC transporter substrate-binding protein n=1 Tax=Mariniradius sediminis TaxID=2909237 RepID=A0ABS9BQR7_9BACT|nr:ABC transporter substrate-binding protein [Mariniradius sediminis]MCF1749719.1 ABC transporter substrate-binding protein [Mariniradius sediminis]
MKYAIIAFVLLLVFGCREKRTSEQAQETRKLITAGGTVTEIVHELGFGDQIIATDITSTYPASMQELPSIGYRNQIKAEGILALGPSLIMAEEGYMTPDVVSQLQAAGIEIQFFKKPTTIEGTRAIIMEIADYLGVSENGAELLSQLDKDMAALSNYLSDKSEQPSMAFVMARGQEMVFVAGEDTFSASLMQMAGIRSAGVGFKDFVPLTPESLATMNPDYLLFFESGLQSIGGKEGVKNIRGIESTTAFQKDQILAYDGLYLSGFGPRVGKAALELAKAVRIKP